MRFPKLLWLIFFLLTIFIIGRTNYFKGQESEILQPPLKLPLEKEKPNETNFSAEELLKGQIISEEKLEQKALFPEPQELTPPLQIINKLLNWGWEMSLKPRLIDTIVIHSSYDALGKDPYSLEGVIKEYELYGVAAHYLIDRQGKIYRLIEDKNIAYHAGKSRTPDGRNNVNDFSIGIELIYQKEESPNEIQYLQLANLIKYLQKEYPIPSKNIFGHSEIAPGRKTDPWNFNWQKFRDLID